MPNNGIIDDAHALRLRLAKPMVLNEDPHRKSCIAVIKPTKPEELNNASASWGEAFFYRYNKDDETGVKQS